MDRCPHPDGCPYADYLNSPPALGMRIRYPNRGRPAPVPLDPDVLRARRERIAEYAAEYGEAASWWIEGWTIRP
ncbi:hypothetical protein L3Q65_00425 (plasmid) [Amycolatopsis sp. FU40]|uniref:hypothetical protein n=1 Tax=Amycolatopsis sp. FU40 TaxID=2914159 RepID=UPI001F2A14F5|nr:hypothetical protein [Amycolatopsis sp. FU40]UKD50793.1 hypothetical protein L3Q65_00425 [Amycolatopsis sp. FU40]